MKQYRPEICAYCGVTTNLTDEHAPPKLVFPEPRPSDLITVRACGPCNQAGQKDAEYFRMCLYFNKVARTAPSVIALKPAFQRSLLRPQAKGFFKALVSALEPQDGGFRFENKVWRIHEVIKRTIQCLYLYETGTRLPDDHCVSVMSDLLFQSFSVEKQTEFRDTFVAPLNHVSPSVIADGQFAYSVVYMPDLSLSIWSLVFYGRLGYIGFTAPNSHATVA